LETKRSDDGTTVIHGYDADRNGWVMPEPSNMHTHFRHPSDPRFPIAVKAAAELYANVTAMPNLGKKDLIRAPEDAIAYRDAIHDLGRQFNPLFEANVPLYLEPDTKPETVRTGFEMEAWIAAKLYPRGGTTQSAEGVDFRQLRDLYPVFAVMEELGMLLLIHAEPVFYDDGSEVDAWDREGESLKYIYDILQTFRNLKVVFEHISSAAGAKFVRQRRSEGLLINATIAPQYLVWDRNQLVRGGMNPEYFSIPVLKRKEDREALVNFMLDGYGFLGTDSAPHAVPSKSKPCGCAGGVFNEPASLSVYFSIFKEEGAKRGITDWFSRFTVFASHAGPMFYRSGWNQGSGLVTRLRLLKEEPWTMPKLYGEGADAIIPMLAGEEIPYRLVSSD